MNRFAGALAAVVGLACVSSPAPAQKEKDKAKGKKEAWPINEKVVEFARKHLGEPVGNGECWTLADHAVRSGGGKSSPAYKDFPRDGDYVWGELVRTVEAVDGRRTEKNHKTLAVLPGDVVQFRDVRFAGARPGGGSYTLTAGHHTAVVLEAAANGAALKILHQNWNGKRVVMEQILNLGDLQSGWLRIYRPLK